MNNFCKSLLEVEFAGPDQKSELIILARKRNWGLALIIIGWLHLAAFLACYYITIVLDYHEPLPYLSIWFGELLGMWVIFRVTCGQRPADLPVTSLEMFIRRVWIAYFLLAFNLGSLNTLRGHVMFEFFPAFASLASFAFIMMSIVIDWRFFGAVLVMFFSGLLMAAFLFHGFLIFALVWWLVLNCIGGQLLWVRSQNSPASVELTVGSQESDRMAH